MIRQSKDRAFQTSGLSNKRFAGPIRPQTVERIGRLESRDSRPMAIDQFGDQRQPKG